MNLESPSFADINFFCVNTASRLLEQNQKFDAIVGITRGGLVPAVILSHHLEIPLLPISYSAQNGKGEYKGYNNSLPFIQGNQILIVDDICDSGHTMKEVVEHYRKYIQVATLAIFYKAGSCFKPDLYRWDVPADGPWIVFPWEKSPE